jgi:predicted metal-binding membrane protein
LTAPGAADRIGLVPTIRAQLAPVAVLFGLAAIGWWWTASRLQGMDEGPWSDLGAFGWFVGVWVVMMAAMMLPSAAPTVALYARLADASRPLVFAAGYLVVWGGAGLLAFAGAEAANGVLAWDRAGRWVAGVVLLAAAVYELTPLKDACLARCRSPLGFLLGSWRGGRAGALRMGAAHGAWCVGCCWALMLSLFALGVMSVAWMAFVAGLIAFEKLVPWRRVAVYGTAAALLALGVLMLASPGAIPGLTVPMRGTQQQLNGMAP